MNDGQAYARNKSGRFVDEIEAQLLQPTKPRAKKAELLPQTAAGLGFLSTPMVKTTPADLNPKAEPVSSWEFNAYTSLIGAGFALITAGAILASHLMTANPALAMTMLLSALVVGIGLGLVGVYLGNKQNPTPELPSDLDFPTVLQV